MISFSNLTKMKKPALAWKKIKNYVLGAEYELSVVFVGNKFIRNLNNKYRKKDKTTDVLSFSLSEKEGEIFINLGLAKKEGIAFLFIHSLLHLKGFEHSVRMESKEKEVMKKFYG